MTTTNSTFEVSKEGLRKLLDRRGGKAFAVSELVQNAWDENVTVVTVSLDEVGPGLYALEVADDNPTGFADLSHAYTLFAESAKKSDPTKRGRFNLGEKFVIAICEEVTIETTTGTVHFGDDGRTHSDDRRDVGSSFLGILRLTDAEVAEIEQVIHSLIPPDAIRTTFNGDVLAPRPAAAEFYATLMTEWADPDGVLHRSERKTLVTVHEPAEGETASLYELGIPVVPTGDRWHVNVGQKVPLNMDRDNVTPAYLRSLRAEVLNNVHDLVTEADADATWITEAIADKRIAPEAMNTALDRRFGEKRVIFDPSDVEANKRAAAAGYTVIAPRSLPKGVSAIAREAGLLDRAGAVTPSPKPYGDGANENRDEKPRDAWSEHEHAFARFAEAVAERTIGRGVIVVMVDDDRCRNFAATYERTSGRLEYNVRVLGRRFFEAGPLTEQALSLLIHELAHHYSSDHLSDEYYDGCTRLGAKLTRLALTDPTMGTWWAQVTA